MEAVGKLTDKTKEQEYQINRLTDKTIKQSGVIENLQEKATDFEHLERYFGRDKVKKVVRQAKELERSEKALKHPKQTFNMSR